MDAPTTWSLLATVDRLLAAASRIDGVSSRDVETRRQLQDHARSLLQQARRRPG
jgi:hypothetical protein